ncbi:MAG: thioredoxin-disulfide reductase [Candidatus Methanofastidiosia archaeon]|jgi:thioredoxin reductase (NADPH)
MDYDLIIVGGGPAGLTAGIYGARAQLKTVILEKLMPGGQAAITDLIENYPGYPEGITGPDLVIKMQEQAEKFGCEIRTEEVISVDFETRIIKTSADKHTWKAFIIATGADPKKLGIPGEAELLGRGISFCATCDGAFFRDKKVAVIGGGDSAIKEALFLSKFASRVYVIHRRDKLRAEKIIQEKAFDNPKIEILWDSIATKILGDQQVKGVVLKNLHTEKESELPVDGVFEYIGRIPNTSMFPVKKDQARIITDENMCTSVKGVFAAGDCRKKKHHQVSTAVGDGAAAAMSAAEYIDDMKNHLF